MAEEAFYTKNGLNKLLKEQDLDAYKNNFVC